MVESIKDENIKTKVDEAKPESNGEEILRKVKQSWITDRIVNPLLRLLKSPRVLFFFGLVVLVVDIYVFISNGPANGFRALVAEGTLSLAMVTYLQMKNAKNQTKA